MAENLAAMNDLPGRQNAAKLLRKELRVLENGILIPGFKNIANLSYKNCLLPLAELAIKDGNHNGTLVENIAVFLSRAMVLYSRIPSFALQPNDPNEYRTAVAEGLQRTVGFKSFELKPDVLLKSLEALVAKVNMESRDLGKPFVMLHSLAKDLVSMRQDTLNDAQFAEMKLNIRASKLKRREFWNYIAGSLLGLSTWLNQHPDFIESATKLPESYDYHTNIMDGRLDIFSDSVGQQARDIWLWKEKHRALVSNALYQQSTLKHSRGDDPADNAPKKAMRNNEGYWVAKRMDREDADTQLNDEPARLDDSPEMSTEDSLLTGSPPFDLDDTATADVAIPSIEDSGAQSVHRELSAPGGQPLKNSDHASDDEDEAQGIQYEQKARSPTEVLNHEDSLNPRFRQVWAMLAKAYDEQYDEERSLCLSELRTLEGELKILEIGRKVITDMRAANRERGQKKVDDIRALLDRFP